jgi:CheY-like chemotaxis protein
MFQHRRNKHVLTKLPSMSTKQFHEISKPIALVVDDEPLIRMDTADIISRAGYHVVEASSADEALEFLIKHSSLHLLFTDVQTGGELDGLELARMVADRWPAIEVVVASGFRLPREGELPQQRPSWRPCRSIFQCARKLARSSRCKSGLGKG